MTLIVTANGAKSNSAGTRVHQDGCSCGDCTIYDRDKRQPTDTRDTGVTVTPAASVADVANPSTSAVPGTGLIAGSSGTIFSLGGFDHAPPTDVVFVDTVPGDTGSTVNLVIGTPVNGLLDTLGDHDWYRITLTAGQTYTFTVGATGVGDIQDSFLNLRSNAGTVLASNDDISFPSNTYSRIVFTATTTGTYFVDVGAYNDLETGNFRLTATADVADGIPGNATTTAAITVGGPVVSGLLDAVGDHDWYRVELVAGQSYLFRTSATGGGSDPDTFIRLFGTNGTTQLAENDDGAGGTYSQIRFTPTTSGTYYLDVGAFEDGGSGSYRVAATIAPPLPVFTNEQIADQLLNGYWGGTQNARRFNVAPGGTITFNLTALAADGQNLAREAFGLWSDATGINFSEITGTANITLDDNQDGAFASSTRSGNIILSSIVNVSTQWLTTYGTGLNSYSFQTYLHEIGHAIGLGHGGPYNGNATYGQDNSYLNDAWATTVMSYFSQNENTYFSNQGFTRQFVVSPVVADVLATSLAYGTPSTTRTGNTVYGFNNTSGRSIYDATQFPSVTYTIVDHGGTDTLDYSGFSQTQRIDLNAETFSNVGGRTGNVSIARGAAIENVVGGSGTDTIIGNGLANQINLTFGGSDTVNAGGGDDIILFGATFTASDSIDGGTGNDQVGISGNYTGPGGALILSAATLTNVEVLALLPGAGNSYSITSNDSNVAAGVEMTVFAGNLGAGQNFTFNGSAESDGFFRTFGGLGTDIITGGTQSDGFYFGPDKWQAGDSVVGGLGGNDQLALDGSYTSTIGASADVEVLVLLAGATPNSFNITLSDVWTAAGQTKTVFGRNNTLGVTINGSAETSGNFVFFGGRAGDTLTGGAGSDQIYGLEGNDIINGGAGSGDIAVFQGTRATYSVVTNNGSVQIVDNDTVADGNDGTDTVVGIEFARFSDQTISITSPIILDLDGGGVETLSAAESNASYDMDGDGIGDDTSWFGRGEGLLFLDRDGNGTLSNAGEMSFTGDVANARSDLEGLAAFDSNRDGQLSSADANFTSFKIWRDRDGDGIVDAREIMTLRQAGVRSLNLTGTANNATTALGDVAVVNTGSFTRTNGRTAGFIDAVLTSFSSRDASGGAAAQRTAASSIDRGLFAGSFADAVELLNPADVAERPVPVAAAATVEWAAAETDLGMTGTIDQRVLLMRQDMAAFADTGMEGSSTDRWRREGTPPVQLYAA